MYLAQITTLLGKIQKPCYDTLFAKCSSIASGFIVPGFPHKLLFISVLLFLIFSIFCCQILYSLLTIYTTYVNISSSHHTTTTTTTTTTIAITNINTTNSKNGNTTTNKITITMSHSPHSHSIPCHFHTSYYSFTTPTSHSPLPSRPPPKQNIVSSLYPTTTTTTFYLQML